MPNGTVIRSTATAEGGNSGASAGVDVVVSTTDLSLGMTNSPNSVAAGAALSYTLHFGNPGGAGSAAAVLGVPLPTGTTFVSASDGGVLVGHERDLELRPDAVGARHQHRFSPG